MRFVVLDTGEDCGSGREASTAFKKQQPRFWPGLLGKVSDLARWLVAGDGGFCFGVGYFRCAITVCVTVAIAVGWGDLDWLYRCAWDRHLNLLNGADLDD
jgi:hypothetical protein